VLPPIIALATLPAYLRTAATLLSRITYSYQLDNDSPLVRPPLKKKEKLPSSPFVSARHCYSGRFT
jgi:hypothetical protein